MVPAAADAGAGVRVGHGESAQGLGAVEDPVEAQPRARVLLPAPIALPASTSQQPLPSRGHRGGTKGGLDERDSGTGGGSEEAKGEGEAGAPASEHGPCSSHAPFAFRVNQQAWLTGLSHPNPHHAPGTI